jgi:hypothetical protein
VLFQPVDAARPDLLHQTTDDLDTRQIALVDRAIKALSGKRLLMQAAVGIAIKEATYLIFQLMNALHRAFDQPPGEILARQPLSADDGVHEVPFE